MSNAAGAAGDFYVDQEMVCRGSAAMDLDCLLPVLDPKHGLGAGEGWLSYGMGQFSTGIFGDPYCEMEVSTSPGNVPEEIASETAPKILPLLREVEDADLEADAQLDEGSLAKSKQDTSSKSEQEANPMGKTEQPEAAGPASRSEPFNSFRMAGSPALTLRKRSESLTTMTTTSPAELQKVSSGTRMPRKLDDVIFRDLAATHPESMHKRRLSKGKLARPAGNPLRRLTSLPSEKP